MANSACDLRVLTEKGFRRRVRTRFRFFGSDDGFSLLELLVVIAVISVLASIMLPVFAAAKAAGSRAKCAAQLKQLAIAALAYAEDNGSRFVPAAPDIDAPGGGLIRWHGVRKDTSSPFDPRLGPLWQYMSKSGGLKECPSAPWKSTAPASRDGFESGCGGYGYNRDYVGGSYYRNPFPLSARLASTLSDVRVPSRTVMFTDAAMPCTTWRIPQIHLIEYSFCEPPYAVMNGSTTRWRTSPSIHFRHSGRASVAWCDGHVTSEKMSFTTKTNIYGADNQAYDVGWFGPDDNSLFDLE
jgi:prepilin-type N-terminal cleavage/methylation domain-containing protein/prepilin-type processing-associated H-X9-DG protein